MGITDKQRDDRTKRIGGSDLAVLLGADKYRSLYDLWLEKTGKLEPLEPNPAMVAGTHFESGVLAYAESELGKLTRNQYRVRDGTHIGVHVDAILNNGEPVEGKTAGLFGPLPEGWGDELSDVVPLNVTVQCHGHMLCTDAPVCHVVAFLGGRGFRRYTIQRSKALIDIIQVKAEDFWVNHVEADVPPDDVPSIDVAKRIIRQEGKVVLVGGGDIARYAAYKRTAADFEGQTKVLRSELMALMGDAEIAQGTDGDDELTYFQQKRQGFDTKRLREEHPDIYERYTYVSKHRVLRLRKIKTREIANGSHATG